MDASGDLTAAALGTTSPFASGIVALCSFLFGSRMIVPYRIVFTALILVGAVASVPLVSAVGTTLNGFMAFPNLVGLLFLLGTVRRLTVEYFGGSPGRS